MKCVEASFIPQIKWRLSKCYKSSQRGAGREGVAARTRHLGVRRYRGGGRGGLQSGGLNALARQA